MIYWDAVDRAQGLFEMIEQQIMILMAGFAGLLIGSAVGILMAASCFLERVELSKVVELVTVRFRNDSND